ncbi:hypothetical protein [Anaerorhabdus furcosa]|uniref:Uncharacterized protein n=1 Tax=Anaerorhabdus furcosa TaxID=118967 RepID=A0A1T4K0H7_9FIRM|nr:hypothetical protein [Anaerorhabdus furcosa]SJZ35869.1 hypothetical protein SAMN02745191_0212 [Anaerorhabdus furcosa]
MKDLMMLYGVTLGIRNTVKQKLFFLEETIEMLKKRKIEYKVVSKKVMNKKINNLYIGNINNAKTIIACAYDTPRKTMMMNNKYFPFNSKKNVFYLTCDLIFRMIVLAILLFVSYLLYSNLLSQYFGYTLSIGLLFACVIVSFLLVKENPNKVNFNLNSASLALALSLVEDRNIAIALVDYGTESIDGFKLLKETVNINQTVVILDSLAAGQQLVCAHKEDVDCSMFIKSKLNFFEKIYANEPNNRLGLYEKSILIASGQIVNKQFEVKNTKSKKDHEIDMVRLEKLRNLLEHYVGGNNEIIVSK